MGMPALKIEPEVIVENRVAKLEANVEHITADVAAMRADIREIRCDVASLRGEMNQGFTQLRGDMAALRIEMKDSLHSAKFWALGLYLALAATMFGVMAKGLGWL